MSARKPGETKESKLGSTSKAKTAGTRATARPDRSAAAMPSRPSRSATSKKAPGSKTSAAPSSRKTSRKAGQAKTDDQAIQEFRKLVNLSTDQLQRWLGTSESKKVGSRDAGRGETAGDESGRKILRIMGKRKDKFTNEDLKHIHVVVGHITRRLEQKPKGDIMASNWRYSLMNWGHDPAK